MNLQSIVGAVAAPGLGHADALAYLSAYLLSSGVEIMAVSVAAGILAWHAGRGVWGAIVSRGRPPGHAPGASTVVQSAHARA